MDKLEVREIQGSVLMNKSKKSPIFSILLVRFEVRFFGRFEWFEVRFYRTNLRSRG